MKKILVIGSLNMDMVAEVDHTPHVGETIITERMELIPGGKGANQAYAAGKLGAQVKILGAVGRDSYGKIVIDSLNSARVDTSYIIKKEKMSTGSAFITVNKNGDNSIVVVAGANAVLSEKDIEENIRLIEECDILVLQMEIPITTVLYAAKRAKELGKKVILDPAPVPMLFPEELYSYIDVIKPNETEVRMLTGHGIDELEKAAKYLKCRGVKNVVVTLGGKGVYINSESEQIKVIPARKVEAVDTTAAGDTFTAAVALKLALGKSLEEAVNFANYVSSIVVTRKGAQTSIPSIKEVTQSLVVPLKMQKLDKESSARS
nr:ribokinase [uncultured Blautia sp.]